MDFALDYVSSTCSFFFLNAQDPVLDGCLKKPMLSEAKLRGYNWKYQEGANESQGNETLEGIEELNFYLLLLSIF